MFQRQHPSARFYLCLLLLAFCSLPAALAKKKPPAHPININTAGATELQQVPGIGPSTAQKILDTRKSYGAFESVDDLLAIKDIGPKLDKMRKYLTVGKPPSEKQSSSPQTAAVPVKPPPAESPAKQSAPSTPAASKDEEP